MDTRTLARSRVHTLAVMARIQPWPMRAQLVLRLFLLALAITAAAASESRRQPQRQDVIDAAARKLAASPLPRRVPRHATAGSTHALFLEGHARPYLAAHSANGCLSRVDKDRDMGVAVSPSINPVAFGADPTATRDSTAAFVAAIAAALNSTHHGSPSMAKVSGWS